MRTTGSRPSRQKSLARTLTIAATLLAASIAHADDLRDFRITGDAIVEPLGGASGDASRGRAIVVDRQKGLCLLCHTGPFPDQRFQGTLAPSLAGAGSRWNPGQLRLRLVDSSKLNPATIMPAYYRIEGFTRVGSAWQNKPVLNAEQIEDVVAFLATLKDPQ
jgi:L-cysteine S-thiosulfotransferase